LVCVLIGIVSATACGGDTAESDTAHETVTGAVGQACIVSFTRFLAGEVVVDDNSGACGSGVCLAVDFEGNVSCPYGQEATGGGCETPSGEPVEGPVAPQLVDRPPSDAIYCSCRCDGPEGSDLCACPTGFECRHLIDDLGLGSAEEYAGSYCIKAGTYVEDSVALAEGPRCDESLGNCEDR
jgi:hypothetical protein